jgi:hypothetical protein
MIILPKFSTSHESNVVEIIRHTYECYEVVAYGLFGQIIARRMYSRGSKRRQWAFEQAERWAETHYLYFDPKKCLYQ